MENLSPNLQENPLGHPMSKHQSKRIWFFVFSIILFFLFIYFLFLSAPRNFPKGIIFNIEPGSSLREVSFNLKGQHIIRSRIIFEAFAIIYGGEKHIISADYLFEDKISGIAIARRISKGERHLAPVKITIPEGFNISDIADISSQKLPYFSKERFLISAKEYEGYLFPDTYFFFTNANEKDVFKSLNNNFEKKIEILRNDIKKSGKAERDIIKMASIIEKESKGNSDRDIISGILWKRLAIGMALQADSAPETYQRRGLPERPIANPGLASIKAAIYPKSSSYLYYLHDKDGNIHYARSFSEHRANIVKYLK